MKRINIDIVCLTITAVVTVSVSLFSLDITEKIIESLIAQGQLDIKYFSDGWEHNYSPIYIFIGVTVLFALLYYIPALIFVRRKTWARNNFFRAYLLIVMGLYVLAVIINAFSFLQISLVTIVPAAAIVVIAGISYYRTVRTHSWVYST
jgi:4-amino-4-deoxy-L-arabinose transferase-like glycosyltransferase